jgi:hypothetical protein
MERRMQKKCHFLHPKTVGFEVLLDGIMRDRDNVRGLIVFGLKPGQILKNVVSVVQATFPIKSRMIAEFNSDSINQLGNGQRPLGEAEPH